MTKNILKAVFSCFICMLLLFGCAPNSQTDITSDFNTFAPTFPPTPEPSPQQTQNIADEAMGFQNFPFPNDTELQLNKDKTQVIFTRQQAFKDYYILWEILVENCPVIDAAKDIKGIDWQNIKSRYEDILSARIGTDNIITQNEFFDFIMVCLLEFQHIGHINAVPYSLYESYLSFLDKPDASEYEKNQLALLESEKVKNLYSYFASEQNQKYNATEKMPEPSMSSEDVEDLLFENGIFDYSEIEGVPYVKVRSCLSPGTDEGDALINLLHETFAESKDAKNIIIDMQGNDGGATRAWIEGIVIPLLGEALPPYYILCGVKSGALNQYFWGGVNPPTDESAETMDAILKIFPSLKEEILSEFDAFSIQRNSISHSNVGFEGNIWVLVDDGTYSAADQFAIFCKRTGFATLVGTETGGNGAGSTPYMFALPNSGLLVRYEAFYAFNDDGTCNAIVGTKPDIEAKEGQTALEACLEQIQNGISGNT